MEKNPVIVFGTSPVLSFLQSESLVSSFPTNARSDSIGTEPFTPSGIHEKEVRECARIYLMFSILTVLQALVRQVLRERQVTPYFHFFFPQYRTGKNPCPVPGYTPFSKELINVPMELIKDKKKELFSIHYFLPIECWIASLWRRRESIELKERVPVPHPAKRSYALIGIGYRSAQGMIVCTLLALFSPYSPCSRLLGWERAIGLFSFPFAPSTQEDIPQFNSLYWENPIIQNRLLRDLEALLAL